MTRNKELRKQIASLRDRRNEHLEKIADEVNEEHPRRDLIER
ncbi:MAG TPA: hypothetical protein VKM55_25480 [Candidatus Lokiarchaeia archaeon]|nr:hypothetical protein [Candidatus Lokiarchaeia archaeon]